MPRAVVVDDRALSAPELVAAAIEQAGLWDALTMAKQRSADDASGFHILIKPDLEAFDTGSAAATDPALVEALIDLLHERGYPHVDVCATTDASCFWADNREVGALADLLGYRYVTPAGHAYDVLDLGEDLVPAPFGEGDVLHESLLGRSWLRADFRICFARNKTDERESYALCLRGLLGVLPLADKDYYYQARMQAGVAVCELLRVTPVHFALVDATVSAHGSGGGRAPVPIETACIIASTDPLLADFVGALKMGLDPYVSPLAAAVYRTVGLPDRCVVDGNLGPYAGWRNVNRVLIDSQRRRDGLHAAHRLLTPWLQVVNPELFPLRQVADARVNPRLSNFFAEVDRDPAALWLLAAVNYAAGAFGDWLNAYRVLGDKDAIRRVEVPIGMDLDDYGESSYAAIRPELEQVEMLIADCPVATDGLRWREIDGATLFEFQRGLPIAFDIFVDRVKVSRTIQVMNDYIGGRVVPIERDADGRIVRQAERNLYLPQPNYLVLYQGKLIDVSKIEICDYTENMHRMCWKTVASDNESAIHDDGMVTFARTDQGTHIRIIGRQKFILPPFWQALDLNLTPILKASLVTHAYKSFFERTCANFEALVEGRDVRTGLAWRKPASVRDTEPFPAAVLEQVAMRFGDRFRDLTAPGAVFWRRRAPGEREMPTRVGEDGFRHFETPSSPTAPRSSGTDTPLAAAVEAFGDFLAGLTAAVSRDAAQTATRQEDRSHESPRHRR
jgi:uncharacterized protein (DUF362 family)